jgi:hypothetical protein
MHIETKKTSDNSATKINEYRLSNPFVNLLLATDAAIIILRSGLCSLVRYRSGEMRCFAPATMTHAPHDVAQAPLVISATNTTRQRSSLLFVCTYSQFLWSGGKIDQAGQNLLGRRLNLIDCQFYLDIVPVACPIPVSQ